MAEERVVGVDKHVYYGKCKTAADANIKEVIIQNPTYTKESINDVDTIYLDLEIGDQLIVTFDNGNTSVAPTLSLFVNDSNTNIGISENSGRVVIASRIDINCNLMWEAGDLISFIYTELDHQSYWKMNVTGPATLERFGTVKIADSGADIATLDGQTAVTYGLIEDLITSSDEALGLDWESSSEEREWGKINLTSNENIIDTATIPKIIANTGDLNNNGDGTGNSKYLKNNEDISFISSGMGIGYIYNSNEGIETIRNFIPYDPVVENENNVRVGYGSLEAYQEVFKDDNDSIIELNPSTWIYGKTIYDAFDEDGSLQIGTIDIPNEHDFEPFYSFNKNGANFTKSLTVHSIVVENEISADEVTADGLTINNDAAITGTLDVTNLNVNNQSIVDLIDSRISPIAVTTEAWYGEVAPTANFFVKRIHSPTMNADKDSHFRIDGNDSIHMQWQAPVINGYTAIGIVGYNLDQQTKNDAAAMCTVWECFYSKDTNMIDFAIRNGRTTAQSIFVYVDLLYVKTSWR